MTDTRVIIYTRFSPRRNADQSESCEMQEALCRQYAEKLGWRVAVVVNDPDASGADEYRDRLWQAIEKLRKGDTLLVYKRDRLARNVYLSEQINRAVQSKQATIAAVAGDVAGDGPEHTMIRQVLAAVAEYERQMIRQRTSHAMRQHQRNGRRMGRFAPYGHIIDPADSTQLLSSGAEQAAISTIYRLTDEGKAIGYIRRYMNEHHKEMARGLEWSYATVRAILKRR
jgi:site-specific DNA recombinase